jgi:hypothetical protein
MGNRTLEVEGEVSCGVYSGIKPQEPRRWRIFLYDGF